MRDLKERSARRSVSVALVPAATVEGRRKQRVVSEVEMNKRWKAERIVVVRKRREGISERWKAERVLSGGT
jgi:hypothetical protein